MEALILARLSVGPMQLTQVGEVVIHLLLLFDMDTTLIASLLSELFDHNGCGF